MRGIHLHPTATNYCLQGLIIDSEDLLPPAANPWTPGYCCPSFLRTSHKLHPARDKVPDSPLTACVAELMCTM